MIPPLDTYPLLDHAALNLFVELHGGLHEELRRTAADELEELGRLAARLVQSCRDAAETEARRDAHDLTGFAAAYGLDRMAHTAEAILNALRAEDMKAAMLLAEDISTHAAPSIFRAREALGISQQA